MSITPETGSVLNQQHPEDIENEKLLAKDVLERKEQDLERFLVRYDIYPRGYSSYDFLSKIEGKINLRGLSPESRTKLTGEVREKLLDIAEAALRFDVDLYFAFGIFTSLGLRQRIIDRVNDGHRIFGGNLSIDLALAVLNYGSQDQAEALLEDWFNEKGVYALDRFEDTEYFRSKLAEIFEVFDNFTDANNLGRGLLYLGGHLATRSSFINAAVELKKKNYDVAIAVMNKGVPLAAMLDYLGQNTRYVEYHRNKNELPAWKKVGSDHTEIKSAERILVCEHDVDTGQTLNSLVPFFERLKPENVDVSFWVEQNNANKEYVKKSPFYGDCYMVEEIPMTNFVENFKQVYEYSKALKAKNNSEGGRNKQQV